MAGSAMARSFNQVSAAIPLVRRSEYEAERQCLSLTHTLIRAIPPRRLLTSRLTRAEREPDSKQR
jgi:hypothetical protein